jgi:hypothetical protein
MKNSFCLFILLFSLISCNREKVPSDTKNFPTALKKGFEAHGSINKWQSYNSLYFDLVKKNKSETHLTNLSNRKAFIYLKMLH